MLSLFSCGGNEENSNPIPTPSQDPTPNPTSIPTPTPSVDSRLPDLTNAVSIRLTDAVNFSGLKDLAKTVFLPLVGDSKIKMSIDGGRENSVSGSVLISFEDSEGFWGAQLSSFDKTGIRTSDMLDMIFADDEFVLRVVGTISEDNIYGNIFYRIRVPNDYECKKIVVICPPVYTWPYWYLPNNCNENIDLVTPCRNYMSFELVKNLGSFIGVYSKWVKR